MKDFFLLGAKDPEMNMIEQLIGAAGLAYEWATAGGRPCHPGNAYRADPVAVPDGHRLVVIECQPANFGDYPDASRIDHHRPGDPGYDCPPAEFLPASSLGQLVLLLADSGQLNRLDWNSGWGLRATGGHSPYFVREAYHGEDDPSWRVRVPMGETDSSWDIPSEVVIMAAFDHCFPVAVRGECPGVTAEDVLALKITEIAKAQGVSELMVSLTIENCRKFLVLCQPQTMGLDGGQSVRDLTDEFWGYGYNMGLLCMQVAAAMADEAVVFNHCDVPTGRTEKISLYNASTGIVEIFMQSVRRWGLYRVYGVPERGYAGCYLQPQ